MRRRRYDTTELVAEVKRERRQAVIWTLAGALIIAGLVALYMTSRRSAELPAVPSEAYPSPAPPPPTTVTAPKPPPPPPPAAKPVPTVAKVQIVLSRKAPLWVDGKPLGPVTEHSSELAPGNHTIKAKLGPKTITQSLSVKAGDRIELRFDAKKRKATLKSLP